MEIVFICIHYNDGRWFACYVSTLLYIQFAIRNYPKLYAVYLLVCLNVPACTILQCSSMALRQTHEDIEKKKEQERRQKIEAVWEARLTVTVSTARIVTPAEVDAAFHSLHWEVEYQGRGKGTAVRVYIQTHK